MLLSDRRCLRTYGSDGESVSETCQDMEQNCLVLRVQEKAIAEMLRVCFENESHSMIGPFTPGKLFETF